MNNRIKIAKHLVKLAKMLVALSHQSVTIGPFTIYVRRMQVGNMRYPGDFVCVSGEYNDMVHIKEDLKRLGFRWDSVYGWHCFWTRVNWNDVEGICRSYENLLNQNTAPAPVEENAEFDKNLTLDFVGNVYSREFSKYGHYRSTTYKRKLIFKDDEGNKYTCYLTNKKRTYHCDSTFWNADGKDFNENLENMVGNSFHVIGTASKVTKNASNYDVSFTMK